MGKLSQPEEVTKTEAWCVCCSHELEEHSYGYADCCNWGFVDMFGYGDVED